MTFRWNAETIHFNAEGAGPPLVLLHGLGGNADNWLPQRAVLKHDHLVLSLDLPGHGRSSGREVRFGHPFATSQVRLQRCARPSPAGNASA